MDAPLQFSDIAEPRPTKEGLEEAYAAINAALDRGERAAALADWDRLRRRYDTWSALVHLRFAQDTTDATAKADRDYADALSPEAAELEVALKRRLLADADRPGLPGSWGTMRCGFGKPTSPRSIPPSSRIWRKNPASRPATPNCWPRRSWTFAGQTLNLAGLGPYAEDPDRETRYQAEKARWGFFEANAAELDDIYDQLVKLRTRDGAQAGLSRPTRRSDTGCCAGSITVRTTSPAIGSRCAEHVVPLVGRLLEARRVENGWDRLRFWDEALIDPAGNPKPIGDHDMLVGAGTGDVRRHGPAAGLVLPGDDRGRFHGPEEPARQSRRRLLHVVSHRRRAVHLRQLQRHQQRYRRVHA